jgi:O-antigen/teichoic acid export membrane protein
MTCDVSKSSRPPLWNRIAGLFGSKTVISAVSILSKIAVRAGTFLVIAPIIGPANQGTIVVTSIWAATVLLIMAFGFQVRVLREMALNPDAAHPIAFGDLRAMAVLALPSAALALIVGTVALAQAELGVFAILFVATMASVVGDYCASSLRSLDQFRSEALLSLSTSILQMLLVVGTALSTRSLTALAGAMAVSRTIYAVASVLRLRRVEAMIRSRDLPVRPLGRTLREGFSFFVDGSLSVLLNGIDILLLDAFVSKDAIGNYAVGSRIVQLFLVFPWIATNILVPALARAEGARAFRREFLRLLVGMVGFALFGAVVLTIGGPLVVAWVLGPKFADLDTMWPVFAVLVVVRFVESSFGIGMTALGRISARVWVQTGAVASITAAAFLLLKPHGINAFVLGIAGTYGIVGAYYAYNLRYSLWR